MKIILITLDALVPEKLGCFGSGLETPNIDHLARNGINFVNAVTVSNTSASSHASMLTGLYPINHKIRKNFDKMDDNIVNLVSILKNNGVYTIGIPSIESISSHTGFAEGFDEFYNNSAIDLPMIKLGRWNMKFYKRLSILRRKFRIFPRSRLGQKTINILKDSLLKNKDKDLFIWCHFFDIHSKKGIYYDKAVEKTDSHIGELIDTLKKLDSLGETMIIITSDHGINLNPTESRPFSHGRTMYEFEMRIPLIFYYPRLLRPKIEHNMVRTIDIMPTILRLFNFDAPNTEGKDIFSNDIGYCIGESCVALSNWICVRTNSYKYVVNNGKEELYDLTKDKDETRNLAEVKSTITNELKGIYNKYYNE